MTKARGSGRRSSPAVGGAVVPVQLREKQRRPEKSWQGSVRRKSRMPSHTNMLTLPLHGPGNEPSGRRLLWLKSGPLFREIRRTEG